MRNEVKVINSLVKYQGPGALRVCSQDPRSLVWHLS